MLAAERYDGEDVRLTMNEDVSTKELEEERAGPQLEGTDAGQFEHTPLATSACTASSCSRQDRQQVGKRFIVRTRHITRETGMQRCARTHYGFAGQGGKGRRPKSEGNMVATS